MLVVNDFENSFNDKYFIYLLGISFSKKMQAEDPKF